MKNIIAALIIVTTFSACNEKGKSTSGVEGEAPEQSTDPKVISNPKTASGDDESVGVAKIVWDETSHDFGKIPANVSKTHLFRFKNVGNIPLVIESATSTCGCTVPEKPKEPIQPGEYGTLTVSFTKGPGEHHKQVTVNTNAEPATHLLQITAIVLDDK